MPAALRQPSGKDRSVPGIGALGYVMTTAFERIGGEPGLRAIIDEFVDRVFDDLMIGFLFRRANRARIKEMEYQHAAEHLGASLSYGGRPLREAHARHRITGGQFARRKKILSDVIRAHGVPDDIHDAWLAHTESLRSQITADKGSECHPRSDQPMGADPAER